MSKRPIRLILLLIFCVVWLYLLYQFPDFRVFTVFIPLSLTINIVKDKRLRNVTITVCVILWSLLFHYESLRHFYLNPLFQRYLPKTKFLFPPAGWIMFYKVDDSFGYTEVYGIKDNVPRLIDPHDIFRTRTIGFDNIHRNILSTVANQAKAKPFCTYLEWRFPYFDRFLVKVVYYPSVIEDPNKRLEQVKYQCVTDKYEK